MKLPLPTQLRHATILGLAALLPASLLAETLNWTGGVNGTGYFITMAKNWAENVVPSASSDLVFAVANAELGPASSIFVDADSITIKSMTFDNAQGRFNATYGVRIVTSNSNTNTASRTLEFASAGTILTLVNNAKVNIRANVFAPQKGDLVDGEQRYSVLNVNLAYSGLGVIDIDSTSELTISAGNTTITGTGGLLKTGAGTLILSGAHTYSGGFVLEDGVVQTTASGSTSSGNLVSSPFGTGSLTLKGGSLVSTTDNSRTIYSAVNLDGNVAITSSETGKSGNFTINTTTGQSTTLLSNSTLEIGSTVTWNQAISGGGSLTKTGQGTLTLNTANTFTGGLSILAGTVSIDAVANLGSAASVNTDAVIIDGGTLQFTGGISASSANRGFRVGASGGTFEIAGGVTTTLLGAVRDVTGEAGRLIKTGDGTLVLSGTGSYTGGTTLSAGTLKGDSRSLQGNIANDAVLVFDQADAGTYAGVLSGTGTFTKDGVGTLTLAGSSSHTGLNTVLAGTLALDGVTLGGSDSAGLNVASGATLAGYGFVHGAAIFAAGSSLAPTGTLEFGGDLDVSAAAGSAGLPVFSVDLDRLTGSDAAFLSHGSLSIGDGLLELNDFTYVSATGLAAGTYTLFASDAAIVGSLGSGLTGAFDGLLGTLAFADSGKAIQLTLAAAPIPEPSTYALLFGALAGAIALYRRRRT